MPLTLQPPQVPQLWHPGQDPALNPALFNTNIFNAFTFLLNKPLFRAHQTHAQTIGPTFAAITMDTLDEDNYGGWGPSQSPAQSSARYYCQAGGWYLVAGFLGVAATTAGRSCASAVTVNGAAPLAATSGGAYTQLGQYPAPGAGLAFGYSAVLEVYLRAGDWIALEGQGWTASVPTSVASQSSWSQLSLVWMGS